MNTLHLSQGKRLELPGRVCTVLVGSDKLSSEVMTFGVTEVAPGVKMDPHQHVQEEIIYIMEGHGEVVIDGVAEPLEEGTVIRLPSNSTHCLENKSERAMRFTFAFHPTTVVGSYDKK